MSRFMLLLHEFPENFGSRSPDEMMAVVKEYAAWSARMREQGKIVGGEKLTDDAGRVLRPKSGKIVVTDGPYLESKEAIGGYFMVSAGGYAEAVAVAESCPHLKYGGRIEVRQIHEF